MLELVRRALHGPVGQGGQRAAPVLLGNDQVDAGANVIARQADLDQHRGDTRTVEAAGHLVEVAREQLGGDAGLRQDVRELRRVSTCESALDAVPAGQDQGLVQLRISGFARSSPPHRIDQH